MALSTHGRGTTLLVLRLAVNKRRRRRRDSTVWTGQSFSIGVRNAPPPTAYRAHGFSPSTGARRGVRGCDDVDDKWPRDGADGLASHSWTCVSWRSGPLLPGF